MFILDNMRCLGLFLNGICIGNSRAEQCGFWRLGLLALPNLFLNKKQFLLTIADNRSDQTIV